MWLIVILVVTFILFITFGAILKKRHRIDLINLPKFLNAKKTKAIRRSLSKSEKFLEKINLETFDGSGGTTHPYILFFEKPFNHFHYYLAHTPYDNNNIEYENPSLAVSNDGYNFQIPEGIKNPLLPIIKRNSKLKKPKFYNDNFLFYENGTLELWYRYTEEDKTGQELKAKSRIYRITSKDGIHFSEPELILDYSDNWYLSPSLIKIKNTYYLYFYNQDYKCYYKTSQNLKDWSTSNPVEINNFTNNCWHGEVKIFEGQIYHLLLSKDYKLYLCVADIYSPNHFTSCEELDFPYSDQNLIYGFTHPYKSSFWIKDGYIDLYIPFAVNTLRYFKIRGLKHIKWTIVYSHLKLTTLKKISKSKINS